MNKYGKAILWGYISTECVFVTELSGNVGISVWRIVWVRANCDSLRNGRSWDRIPVRAIFSALVQAGPGEPSLLYNGYRVFPGV